MNSYCIIQFQLLARQLLAVSEIFRFINKCNPLNSLQISQVSALSSKTVPDPSQFCTVSFDGWKTQFKIIPSYFSFFFQVEFFYRHVCVCVYVKEASNSNNTYENRYVWVWGEREREIQGGEGEEGGGRDMILITGSNWFPFYRTVHNAQIK